ncbi:hypothetical protein H8446_13475 (plasmid) [Enterococcus faecalis]|uniref:hypothetical protein n=1 Tax=Enterococcus faecalis TaxID=1351 RepID=UPI001AD7AB23|nr:hypothetical protein [Enterococcus faecalis]EKZ0520072.1 hypothetical protein [Enterococcus faecalis]QTI54075.1 hypothetical protein H8446_13475 [Enterococcus faecalis]HAP3944860.1 hypothetical protein [Enterococcus faecalis]HAP4023019.1 hypothetical protein [Enterococcus faecalis]HAP4079530.1 hypothetical protein [Enterococcus faecalis]
MNSRKEFDLEGTYNGEYDPLLSSNDNFASDNFDDLINSTPKANSKKKGSSKRGRPVKITDERYKVIVPTKISKATDVKLYNLKSYMSEFREHTGRITFDKIINALAENYIKTQLPATTEKILREQIQEDFEKLEK